MAQEWAVGLGLLWFGLLYAGARVGYWLHVRPPDLSHLPEIVTSRMPEYGEAKLAMMAILSKEWKWRELDNFVLQHHPYKPFVGGRWFPAFPKPFSCADLHLLPTEGGGIIFMCGRIGCLCSPARGDLTGDYPEYCPPEDYLERLAWDWDDEDYYNEEDYY